MTAEDRERLLDYNEELCRRYNATDENTEDAIVNELLGQIAATERILFSTRFDLTLRQKRQI